MFYGTNVSFVITGLSIRGNKINYVESATNLDIVFNGRLSWSSHISVIVGKIYSMLRNLWTIIDSTPFAIRMQIAKTYLIPALLYGYEIFENCVSQLVHNNIARYDFLKRRRDHISHSACHIFGVKFDNLLQIICLILFHKVINTGQP